MKMSNKLAPSSEGLPRKTTMGDNNALNNDSTNQATSVFREEIKQFLLTTSMRGVPRAAKADWRAIRWSWAITVILLLALVIYNSYMLFAEYFAFPKTTDVNVVYLDKGAAPQVVLCNENALASLNEGELETSFGDVIVYKQLMDALANHFSGDEREHIRTTLHEPRSLYQNLLSIPESGNPQNSSLVASCEVAVLVGQSMLYWPCSNNTRISTFMDPDHFRCTLVEHDKAWYSDKGKVVGTSFTLYLNNAFDLDITNSLSLRNLVRSSTDLHGNGAIVQVKHGDQPAMPALHGVRVATGSMATVHVAMEKHVRLPKPYGECEEREKEYNEIACYNKCLQNKVRNKCHCTDARLSGHFVPTSSHPYCLQLDPDSVRDWIADSPSSPITPLDRYACATQILIDADEECRKNCPLRCEENVFEPRVSTSAWPPMTGMAELYEKYIEGREYEERFEIVRQAINGECTGQMECELLLVRAQTLLESNFLHLTVQMAQYSHKEFVESPALTVADLLAKLGGVMNLWAGITVVVFIEVIETLVRMCVRCARKSKEGKEQEANQ